MPLKTRVGILKTDSRTSRKEVSAPEHTTTTTTYTSYIMSSSTTYPKVVRLSPCDLTLQELQALKNNAPDLRYALAKDGATNPLRHRTKAGTGTTHTWMDPEEVSEEDVLFSGVNRDGNGICMLHEDTDDGTVRVVIPFGTPPDQVAKFQGQAKVLERKSKMRAHLKKKVAEKKPEPKQKRERTETAEEYAARWKATAELIGKEEAAKLQDAEFWEGPQQVAAMD